MEVKSTGQICSTALRYRSYEERVIRKVSNYSTKALSGVTAKDLDWLSGTWFGQYGNDEVEEQWSTVRAGTMMGVFRWLKGDSVSFYELLVLSMDADRLVMRLKHFNSALVGQEEKDKSVDFALVELNDREAVFMQLNKENPPWLVYRMESTDQLVTYFETDGEAHRLSDRFVYTRQQ